MDSEELKQALITVLCDLQDEYVSLVDESDEKEIVDLVNQIRDEMRFVSSPRFAEGDPVWYAPDGSEQRIPGVVTRRNDYSYFVKFRVITAHVEQWAAERNLIPRNTDAGN